MERLFCLPNVQICAVWAALNNINYITLFMPVCCVLWMDRFLYQCVGKFKVNWDAMFIEDPPEFVICCVAGTSENVVFSSPLCLLWIF